MAGDMTRSFSNLGCECGASVSCVSSTSGSEVMTRVHEIPLMNAVAPQYLKDGHLVRFRGMIQDMHNPEFYFEQYEIFNKLTKETRLGSGKYRDTADIGESEVLNYNSSKLKSAERQTISVISMPGFNDWAKNIENSKNTGSHLVNPPSTSRNSAPNSNTNMKRNVDSLEDCDLSNNMEVDESSKHPNKEKSPKVDANDQFGNVSRDHILNFPLPDNDGKLCLVKVYDNYDKLKINDMVEIIGYLSVDPALSSYWNGNVDSESDTQLDAETLTHNPPPSLVPRIHAIHIEQFHHCNPLLEQSYDTEKAMEDAENAREHIHKIFTQILLGDSLAADYLICHLISHIYIRRDVLSLGKFALNLWKIPSQRYPQYGEQLYGIIKEIVTKSFYLPLTTDNLNDLAFIPKKDYECNRLTSGILQLSKNTHLILDETKMQPGQLNSSGVLNISTLGDIIQNQKVKYDFKYYTMEYNCDIPILILSEGKSLLPNEISLPIIADNSLEIVNETFEAAKHYLTPDILNQIRIYLTTMQLVEYNITEEPQYIQDDFIEMRKNNSQNRDTDAEHLHRLLVLTRLVCLSKGYNSINKTCWDIAKNMEEQRLARL